MGTSTLIDIIGSMIIGGLMLLTLHSVTNNVAENSSQYHGDLISQQNLVSIIELIELDFSRIGYCEIPDSMLAPNDMIEYADSTSIRFWTDLGQSPTDFHGDGIKEKLIYELGPDVNGTPNPDDRLLYRYVEGTTKDASNLGITMFKISYFDNLGFQLPHPINAQLISSMIINIKVEDCYGYDTDNIEKSHTEKFPTVFWRQIRLANKNMSR
ncbi:MAG: hypothetical protein H6613_15365 [Ignavibacteriales bacterium]|nr:hypothetical protein [Ignavibacteriota bacterium]MCB9249822.1 hypothetical protein [Ignavibacteriales bacterium]